MGFCRGGVIRGSVLMMIAVAAFFRSSEGRAEPVAFVDDFSDGAASEAVWMQGAVDRWSVVPPGVFQVTRPEVLESSTTLTASPIVDPACTVPTELGVPLTIIDNSPMELAVDVRVTQESPEYSTGIFFRGDVTHPDVPALVVSLGRSAGMPFFVIRLNADLAHEKDHLDQFLAGVFLPSLDPAEWHRIEVTVAEGQIEARLDGTVVLQAAVPALPQDGSSMEQGAVGLFLFPDPRPVVVQFDNFSLTGGMICDGIQEPPGTVDSAVARWAEYE